ncbi:uncharacterized protein LOC143918278 [Arctopsyche grandis]|uniref:uncharacterized protein LOC143918278 n=1 Tax=Arctopsyche grandis TaxID=121162 RepID=UPI00406DA45B
MRSCALLLATVFVGTYAADSDKCKDPPDYHVEMCCDGMDVLLTEKDFDDCKFAENMVDGNLPPCDVFNCLFKNHDMMIGPDKLNRPKTKELLMKSYGKEWSSVIENSIKKCFKLLDDQKSPCEAKTFMLCFYDYTTHACPIEHWTDTQECNDAKAFDEVCGHRSLYE